MESNSEEKQRKLLVVLELSPLQIKQLKLALDNHIDDLYKDMRQADTEEKQDSFRRTGKEVLELLEELDRRF